MASIRRAKAAQMRNGHVEARLLDPPVGAHFAAQLLVAAASVDGRRRLVRQRAPHDDGLGFFLAVRVCISVVTATPIPPRKTSTNMHTLSRHMPGTGHAAPAPGGRGPRPRSRGAAPTARRRRRRGRRPYVASCSTFFSSRRASPRDRAETQHVQRRSHGTVRGLVRANRRDSEAGAANVDCVLRLCVPPLWAY